MTFDVAKAVDDAKGGKLEYRTDRGANVHVALGKKSFEERRLLENYAAIVEEVVRVKPAAGEGPLHPPDHAHDHDGPAVSTSTRHAHAGSSRSLKTHRPKRRRRPLQ